VRRSDTKYLTSARTRLVAEANLAPAERRCTFLTIRRTAAFSFATDHSTGFASPATSTASLIDTLCASIPTKVITFFMTGSFRMRLCCRCHRLTNPRYYEWEPVLPYGLNSGVRPTLVVGEGRLA